MNPDYKANSSFKIPQLKPLELKNVYNLKQLFKNKCDQQTIDFLA